MNGRLQSEAQRSSPDKIRDPFGLIDALLLLVIVFIVAAGCRSSLGPGGNISEDGTMLVRYAQHLAEHEGITWNVGQPPVEGATDFLYMVSVAGVARMAHEDAVLACRQLLFACCMALPCVIFLGTRLTLRTNRWLAFALALYVVAGVGSKYLSSFFGVPFMLLMVALTWWVGVGFIAGRIRINWPVSLLFSFLALLIGLTRPEGNLHALLLLAAVVYLRGFSETRKLMVTFVTVFVVLGGSYFVWRWHYFGYPLPNPFYVKGGGHLHLSGLVASVKNTIKILWPLLPLAALAIRNGTRMRLLFGLSIPLIGFTGMWVLLSNENNHLMRFQMPILPVVLLFLPLLLEDVLEELGFSVKDLTIGGRAGLIVAAGAYSLAGCAVFNESFSAFLPSSGIEFATHLSQYAGRGYTMAVTEAGQFPYFSRWNAIDALGLNDSYISHHGIDEAYLDRYKPELILYHYYKPQTAGHGLLQRDLADITTRDYKAITVLHSYAVHHSYILAAAYGGEPCSLNVFYVRPDTPDTDAIVDYLRNTPYYFLDNNILSVDYRNGIRPECKLPPLEVE